MVSTILTAAPSSIKMSICLKWKAANFRSSPSKDETCTKEIIQPIKVQYATIATVLLRDFEFMSIYSDTNVQSKL